MSQNKTTIDDSEIEKFTALADQWWDEEGKFKPLHQFNPIRISYLKDKIAQHFKDTKNLSVLDIGCGGGLLSEPMARMGFNVTAIDAGEKNIKIASLHAEKSELDIRYINTSAEELQKEGKQYDIVLNMEVIEHVADVKQFVDASSSLVKPGGLMFVATINRTLKSLMLAKIGAEYILRWLPVGTHSWQRFLKPSEIDSLVDNMQLAHLQGISFNMLNGKWYFSSDVDVNYIMMYKN